MEEQIHDLGQKDALFYPLGILLMEIRSIIMLMNQKRHQETLTMLWEPYDIFHIDLKVGPIIEKGQLLMLQLNIP